MFVSRIPLKTIIYLIISWILLAILNIILMNAGFYEDVQKSFPIALYSGPTLHLYGIPYLFLFLVVLAFGLRFASKLTIYHVWLICIFLIVLGNLGQGSWDSAFYKPFYETEIQYYHDAITINSWRAWLESFNDSQYTLLMHTRTHPPFAVLIHYLLLKVSGNSLPFLSMTFVLISSLSIVLVWHIFKALGTSLEKRNVLAVLFTVIPAVNIFSAVSLDAIILVSATLFLFGIIVLCESKKMSILGLLSILFGLLITNLLTYGGLFLVAVAAILALKEIMINRRFNLAFSLVISIIVFLVVNVMIFSVYGYNHIQGFLTATAIENPGGFRGLKEPFEYLATRIESICEIAILLSFGFLAMLFHPKRLGFSWLNWRNKNVGVMLAGIMILLAMFASGAYRTGETGRAAIFIYPYIMLALTNTNLVIVRDISVIAGLQTVGMQLTGNYFW